MNSTHHITKLLHEWNNGDDDALNRLIPLADSELKKIARYYMSKERQGHLFEPADLVEEAWLKLLREKKKADWKNRSHFYALLARRMRQILIDYVRPHPNVEFTGITGKVIPQKQSREIEILHALLKEFSQINPRAARVVELRYFGGYTIPDVAEILGIGSSTVENDTEFARGWLFREMMRNNIAPPPAPVL